MAVPVASNCTGRMNMKKKRSGQFCEPASAIVVQFVTPRMQTDRVTYRCWGNNISRSLFDRLSWRQFRGKSGNARS